MKRIFKLCINFLMALIAVGITFAVLLWINPEWQRRLAEEVLSGDPVRQWQIGELALGMNGARIGGVFVLDGKAGVELTSAVVRGPLWKTPFTRRLEIESGEVSGLFIDVSQIRVGDLTSSDYQALLERVSGDATFWRERLGLVMSKMAAAGWQSNLRNVDVRGQVMMPGGRLIPLNLRIIEADSRQPPAIQVRLTEVAQRD